MKGGDIEFFDYKYLELNIYMPVELTVQGSARLGPLGEQSFIAELPTQTGNKLSVVMYPMSI